MKILDVIDELFNKVISCFSLENYLNHLASPSSLQKTLTYPPFKCINNIHNSNRLATSVFSVSVNITNKILKKYLENTMSLFIDLTTNTLHTTTPRKRRNRGFRDTLNVISKNFPVTLCTTISQTLSSFPSSIHDCFVEIFVGIYVDC